MREAIPLLLLFLLCGSALPVHADEGPDLPEMILRFKADPRGPYEAIRWFCPDGRVLPASERCPSGGGIQHALPKKEIRNLADRDHIYLGQILAGTDFEVFLDRSNRFSRLKQYQLERYLQSVDDGWILRRARHYRGAVQFEDEARWGRDFLAHCLGDDELVATRFFLLRQAVKDIPHQAQGNRWAFVRAQSKAIADAAPGFGDLRVKLHGQPEPGDIARVRAFLETERERLVPSVQEDIRELLGALESLYRRDRMEDLAAYRKLLPHPSESDRLLAALTTGEEKPAADAPGPEFQMKRMIRMSELLLALRRELKRTPDARSRLAMMDLSVLLEERFFVEAAACRPRTVGEAMGLLRALAGGCVGSGFLELWEWELVKGLLDPAVSNGELDVPAFLTLAEYARRISEWGAAMAKSVYGDTVERFAAFEPLARGYLEDRVRGSLLLPFGEAAGLLGDLAGALEGRDHRLMQLAERSRVRGLNPGVARGTLYVVEGKAAPAAFDERGVYALEHPPSDLKPVAGILSVSEGNPVSHVQLLARSLGIPNAVISGQHLAELKPFAGQTVFFAVSPGGTVRMKPEDEVTPQERELVEQKRRSEERIRVPVAKMDLDIVEPVDLKAISFADSGRLCGPKAANLGQLQRWFPGYVGNGVVIPFGVFRRHLEQPMPGTDGRSYWAFLARAFADAEADRAAGAPKQDIDAAVLEKLGILRDRIREIRFLPTFPDQLRRRFLDVFGTGIGSVPVFVRSDTNMEDLKDFTGAGLNLTVFNVVDEETVWQAIRDVWASPFTERSYRWRQKFLLNPENVYPSVLLQGAENVDKSGVMITAGLDPRQPGDVTAAFSRGPGGAVEGQMSESYRMDSDGAVWLLSPSREPVFNRLPPEGGVRKVAASFETRILDSAELQRLRDLSGEIARRVYGTPGMETDGPLDVELGFRDGRIRLFQVRPFVENKRAKASVYLLGLDPPAPEAGKVSVHRPLP